MFSTCRTYYLCTDYRRPKFNLQSRIHKSMGTELLTVIAPSGITRSQDWNFSSKEFVTNYIHTHINTSCARYVVGYVQES